MKKLILIILGLTSISAPALGVFHTCRFIVTHPEGQSLSLLRAEESASERRESEALNEMIANGQASWAEQILEEKLSSNTITVNQAFILMGIYKASHQSLEEANLAAYTIETLEFETYQLHLRQIQATERHVRNNNAPDTILINAIQSARAKYETSRDFMIYAARVLFRNNILGEADFFARTSYQLSTTDSQKEKTLIFRIRIARAAQDMRRVHSLWTLTHQQFPNNVRAIFWLSYSEYRTYEQHEKALATLENIFNKNPDAYFLQRAYVLKTRILLRLNLRQKAARVASTGRAAFPENTILESLDSMLNSDSYDEDSDEYIQDWDTVVVDFYNLRELGEE